MTVGATYALRGSALSPDVPLREPSWFDLVLGYERSRVKHFYPSIDEFLSTVLCELFGAVCKHQCIDFCNCILFHFNTPLSACTDLNNSRIDPQNHLSKLFRCTRQCTHFYFIAIRLGDRIANDPHQSRHKHCYAQCRSHNGRQAQ